jgi:iron complex transport system substrate-binding protein
MTERPGWQRLRAVREQRICIFNSDDEDAIVRPGPRMAEGARLLAQCILKHSGATPTSQGGAL